MASKDSDMIETMLGVWEYYKSDKEYKVWISDAIIDEKKLRLHEFYNDYHIIRTIYEFLQSRSELWEMYREYSEDKNFQTDLCALIVSEAKKNGTYPQLAMDITKVI